jgi:general L-amino acid transport system substrate-binding protein
MAGSANPASRRLLGSDGGIGNALGLDDDVAAKVIQVVGNYGEIYERNVGSGLAP